MLIVYVRLKKSLCRAHIRTRLQTLNYWCHGLLSYRAATGKHNTTHRRRTLSGWFTGHYSHTHTHISTHMHIKTSPTTFAATLCVRSETVWRFAVWKDIHILCIRVCAPYIPLSWIHILIMHTLQHSFRHTYIIFWNGNSTHIYFYWNAARAFPIKKTSRHHMVSKGFSLVYIEHKSHHQGSICRRWSKRRLVATRTHTNTR